MKQLSVNNILVIEDNREDTQLISEYLKTASFKYKLFHSPSLIGGLDLIEEKTIDLVLLDLSLDDTSGFSTLTDYLEKVDNIPVIVLTGNTKESVGIRSVSAGAQDFLVKGKFDERRLVSAIKYSIQRFKSQVELKEKNKLLSIKEKRYREAQKIGKYTNWEMNIVNNEMKWSDEMFDIFGFSHQRFKPVFSDYLRSVHIEDKEKVETFFEKAIKTGELTKIKHRILVNGRQIKLLSLRVQVKYDEVTNKLILFGNLQEITESKNGQSKTEEEKTSLSKGLNLEYSAAIPKNFDYFKYLISTTAHFKKLFDSELSPVQEKSLSNLALSIGNYIKSTSNFHNLLPILEQKSTGFNKEFNLLELYDEIKLLFILQKILSKTIVNISMIPCRVEKLSGNKKDIQNIIFNLVLQAIAASFGSKEINVSIQTVGKSELALQFNISFHGDLSVFSKIKSLSKDPSIFTLNNLKNVFREYELDIITTAFLLNRNNAILEIAEGAIDKVKINFPVKLIEEKIKDGKIYLPVRILLAEDHVMNQIVMKKTLTSWSDKITVNIADSGPTTLEYLKSEHYDLVIMNVNLHGMDGIETLRAIRQNKEVPVLGISSNPSVQEKILCFQAGMNTYLKKPFSNELLFSNIIGLLHEK